MGSILCGWGSAGTARAGTSRSAPPCGRRKRTPFPCAAWSLTIRELIWRISATSGRFGCRTANWRSIKKSLWNCVKCSAAAILPRTSKSATTTAISRWQRRSSWRSCPRRWSRPARTTFCASRTWNSPGGWWKRAWKRLSACSRA